MTFFVRAGLSGTIDQDDWRAAMQTALLRHPLLSATLSGDASRRTKDLVWRVNPALTPALFWVKGDGPVPAPFGTRIDAHREAPVRMCVRQWDGVAPRAEVTLQLHHAACDAAGGTAFLEDVLCHYAIRRGEPLKPRPLVEAALSARSELTRRYADLGAWRIVANLDRIVRFFFVRPVALAASDAPRDDGVRPMVASRVMSEDDLAGLRRAAKLGGGTVNDLLLRDLFVTLTEWNERRGEHGPVRLSMPINMRELGDQMLPACNIVSMCFLDRYPSDCRQPDRLLTGIAMETTTIKRWHLGTALLHVVALAGRVAGVMPRIMKVPPAGKTAATAVLSNLGRVLGGSPLPGAPNGELSAGGLTLQSVELLPPVRPGTAMALGCVTFGDKLFLSLHHDPSRLGADDAKALLAQLSEKMKRSVALADERVNNARGRLAGAVGANGKIAPQSRLWSLPIGKNVHPASLLPERLPAMQPERQL
jgi:hypothetical protein